MGSANVIASWGPDAVSFSRENNGLNQYVSWTRGPINQDDDMGSDWGSPGHANGVTMQEGWITASYNALNQPKAIWSPSYPGGALAQYLWFGFDPLGRCVKRWMGSATGHAAGSTPATYYYYDGWDLIQEGPGGTTVARTYVHGSRVDEIVASQAGGEWVYHHYDARGHCILLTNASNGTIREQYDYDAFGYPYFYNASGGKLGSAAQFGNRFLFTGREWLKELRVYDYRNRIYQPELGRFLQPDPIGFENGDYNLYRYCHNDPVNKSDPTGLIPLTGWGGGDWDFFNGIVALEQMAQQAQTLARSEPKEMASGGRTPRAEKSQDGVRRGDGYGSSAVEAGLMREGDAKKIARGDTEGVSEIGQDKANPKQFYANPAHDGNKKVENFKDSVKRDNAPVATSAIDPSHLPINYKLVGAVLAMRLFSATRAGEDIQRAKNRGWQTFIITSPERKVPVIYDKTTNPNPTF